MAFEGPCTVLGGLPMWAVCWYTRGDGWETDDDCGVTSLHWQKRDGSKGAEVSQKIYDRLEKADPYWESPVVDAVSEHVAFETWCRENPEKAERYFRDFGSDA